MHKKEPRYHRSKADGVVDYMGVPNSASQDDISKALRKRGRQLHPDKVKQSLAAAKAIPTPPLKAQKKKPGVHVSKGPTDSEVRDAVKKASERYARLTIIAAVLKGSGRERYDHFLSNGFPKWKGTGYYYARFRPGLSSVLVGLFVTGGGLVHYAALYLSWKRQREFVGRYVRQARRAAWGDESAIKGIPGVDGASAAPPPASSHEDGGTTLNRRQKRMQERESKKDRDKKKPRARENALLAPVPLDSDVSPQGPKKKVQAENGKVLIVDSLRNVFLEEEDENGQKCEYLLDPDELAMPTIRETVLFRLPTWIYDSIHARIFGVRVETGENNSVEESSSAGENWETVSNLATGANGRTRRRGERSGKAQ